MGQEISTEQIQQQMRSLSLAESAQCLPELLQDASKESWSYNRFLYRLMGYEQKRRDEKQVERRLKWAAFPFHHTLEAFRLDEQQSLSRTQMNQLQTLNWIDQLYNLILLGPPGVGKTHLAVGLGIQAIEQGYRVMFVSMGELIHLLKTEGISRKSQIRLKRIRDANLVILDDLMFMAMNASEANLFFHLINDLYDHTAIVLTSNKAPTAWGELLGDPAITTAILDRLIHRAEIIHLNGDSYRMKHRTSIFGKQESKSVQT
ncbi:MAG: IS21-like element helper ATPase IstB [Sporolactobacillus sp.]